jgi:hypothetical protein
MSTATSNSAPRPQRTSLACACGGAWKCRPRTVPTAADSEWLSCTKSIDRSRSRPAAPGSRFRKRSPRAMSPKRAGVRIRSPGMPVSSICMSGSLLRERQGKGAACVPGFVPRRGHARGNPGRRRDPAGSFGTRHDLGNPGGAGAQIPCKPNLPAFSKTRRPQAAIQSKKSPPRPRAQVAGHLLPSFAPSSTGAVRSSVRTSDPSGRRISPRSRSVPPSSSASPAIGVSQDPSRPARNARSAASRCPVGP